MVNCMAIYVYRARKKTGCYTLGFVSASSSVGAAMTLKEKGFLTVWVFRCLSPGLPDRLKYRGIRKKQLYLFCKQLSAMLEAGVGLEQSLVALSGRAFHKSFKLAVISILTMLRRGSSLSQALGKYPHLYPELMVNMVQAAEMSGALPEVLEDLAGYYERENDFTGKVKSVLIYPAFLLVATTLLIIAIVNFVMPKYISAYSQLNIDPPLPALMVIQAGIFFKSSWFWMPVVGIILYFFFKKFYATEAGCRLIAGIPLAGRVLKFSAISRYCWVAGMLLDRGVPILAALEVAGRVPGNALAGAACARVTRGIMAGHKMTRMMYLDGFFPPLLVQMLKIGEETGNLGGALLKAAHFYRGEGGFLLKNILTSIEPLLILIMGGIIGLLAMAMLLPMVNLINSI